MRASRSMVLPALVLASLLAVGCQSRPAAPAAQPPAAATAQPAAAAKPAAQPAAAQPGAAAPAPAADDQAVANFYRGKTLRIVVGYAAGGGFDAYSRVIARHFAKHIPGSPNVIVENMPGAGSLVAANHVYAASRPDGLTVGNFIGTLLLQQILGAPGIEFDGRKYRYLGVPVTDNNVCAVRKDSGFHRFSDAIGSPQPLIFGGLAPGTPNDDVPKLLQSALGMNIRLVSGYSGTATLRQAADSGEVMGGCWAWESIKVTWKSGLDSGEIGVIGRANAQPIADLPNVDSALDMARTDADRQLLTTGIVLPGRISRIYAVHPDTPNDRVQALRQAWMATMRDPGFLEDMQKSNLDVDPIPGDQVEKLALELFETPEAIKERLRTILLQ
jgi:tripartite-type tricarboxylate transporter receptor subunit TctC